MTENHFFQVVVSPPTLFYVFHILFVCPTQVARAIRRRIRFYLNVCIGNKISCSLSKLEPLKLGWKEASNLENILKNTSFTSTELITRHDMSVLENRAILSIFEAILHPKEETRLFWAKAKRFIENSNPGLITPNSASRIYCDAG